jgi:phosphate transport system permease protein
MIARVAVPLFLPGSAALVHDRPLPGSGPAQSILAAGADEYRETGYTLDDRGEATFFQLAGNTPLGRQKLAPPSAGARRILAAQPLARLAYALAWDDGTVSVERIKFTPRFDGAEGARRIEHAIERVNTLPPPDGPRPLRTITRLGEEGRLTRADLLPGDKLAVTALVTTTDVLGEATTETKHAILADDIPGSVTALALDSAGKTLYAGTSTGHLVRWNLADLDKPEQTDRAQASPAAITALAFVLGDISLAVGDARGNLSTWFPVRGDRGANGGSLRRIHTLRAHRAAVTSIVASPRDKSLLSLDSAGRAHLDHMTSERHLLTLSSSRPLRQAILSPRNDGVVALAEDGRVLAWELHTAYPEVSLKTLFGKVWYEHYAAPAWVWQSTASSEDYEPKLSLVPLLYGTLKGTFYALIFAVPLAVLGALYTSQFMRPELRRFVKPAIEVMAAIPSVVIGFLAALWLAPRVERSVIGVFLAVLFIPACLVATLLFWQFVERRPLARRLARGHEFIVLVPVILAALALALWLGPWIEKIFFAGSFTRWLFSDLAVRYDQRNCIIIAFALGFAVIPIIFTIADDSLSNIPRSLTAASLALGASRWQTAWRVVLPSASPGIFAAIMIGLGRAVGETMIVLMATGNTPIMDANPFDGMRTLSANIAVEIAEAPVGGSLYRVLFLTAVLLFLMTFVLNTAAEIVRQRLRRKFGQL